MLFCRARLMLLLTPRHAIVAAGCHAIIAYAMPAFDVAPLRHFHADASAAIAVTIASCRCRHAIDFR